MNALELKNLKKTYAGGKVALHGIDLNVKEGDFFALLGPNGAGKSTAIGIITGLVDKSEGEVIVFGKSFDKDPGFVKSCIGLVPQEFNFNQFEPCDEILINQAGYFGVKRNEAKERAKVLLDMLELTDKAKELSRALSGGMKRRLMIARALMHRPKLLILDEPTAGVDIEIRRATWALLKKINAEGTTIILTTHYLEEAELLCRNIAIINKGEITKQTSMDLLLRQLQTESFILNLTEENNILPKIDGIIISQINPLTLEVAVTKPQTIQDVFDGLSKQNIRIDSLRNKSNRLEELFLKLTA
ncbi:ABC transporter ATPase [Gammaproteobacteria bacterium]|nr:ABC transporter ATPase [Gammaproteobacteria bacterium]